MPIEINELEQQFGSLDGSQVLGDTSTGENELDTAMTPYTLRKVTQVPHLHVCGTMVDIECISCEVVARFVEVWGLLVLKSAGGCLPGA